MTLEKQVVLVVGASRGIGRQVAIDLAKNNYIVIVAAKTTSKASESQPFPPDPNSPASTINTVTREIIDDGGEALEAQVDVRDFDSIQGMVAKVIQTYKRLDVLLYNPGAIWWAAVEKTPLKRYQLMQQVNSEGLYGCVQACLPHFYKSGSDGMGKGRIVVISPPVYSRFLRGKTAYAMTKWAMSALTMGLAMDWVREGRTNMAITSLWPAAAIVSAATQNPQTDRSQLRKPTIFSDAILTILRAAPADVNGKTLLDEDFLRQWAGVTDFSKYALVPGSTPRRIMPAQLPDLSVKEQADEGTRMDSTKLRGSRL
ncbi:NAD(P)-binding protein [Teratosphaeria nubilosa]|uniref:NAD(P)-binding protein n=1 Tax=Teratosphaeria nubilosa TaxID=161662 RepID=A0A6G1LE65_9PEZI|nr:NAD(P)-binding protein [Teratosphaeria nubilosa]